jgi:hypothetical protein
MSKTKLEIVFVQLAAASTSGFSILGEFSVDSEGPSLPLFPIGGIGEVQIVDLPGKQFSGRIIDKRTIYSQKDMAGKSWDFLTRVIVTLELTDGEPDARFRDVNEQT